MNRAVPTMTEPAEALKIMLKAEDDVKRAQRLQMRSLFAAGQDPEEGCGDPGSLSRDDGGLRGSRCRRWMCCHAGGACRPRQGATLREAVACPTGFALYGEMVDWRWQQHGGRLAYAVGQWFAHLDCRELV